MESFNMTPLHDPRWSDSTHTNIRILLGCITFCAAIYILCTADTKPREHVVTLKIQIAPPK